MTDTRQQVEELRRRLAQAADACRTAETALRLALAEHNPTGGHRDAAGNLTDGPADAELYDLVDCLALPRVRAAFSDVEAAGRAVTMPAGYGQALTVPRGFDPAAVQAVLEADHGPDCYEGDEEVRGHCVCAKGELGRALAEATEVEGRYE